ncbi:hypothetical protein L6R53_15715 [Myxococcota bacterium]|nr:hypothetical protein [Myxococcota bacterium]
MSCAGYAPFATSPEQDAVLDRLRARPRPGDVAVLDLDGCLFDNRWRQVQILQEYAGHRDLPELYGVRVEHFRDWSLSRTLLQAGVDPDRVHALRDDLRAFWAERFFDGDYVGLDHPMPGAVRLVRALLGAGAHPVYLTGRDRGMHDGTARALARCGFPAPGEAATLLTKPDPAVADEAWKADALGQVCAMGTPTVFLDNEPVNVNLFHDRFPAALVVFVSTDHSFRPDRPHPALPAIRGFLRTDDRPTLAPDR